MNFHFDLHLDVEGMQKKVGETCRIRIKTTTFCMHLCAGESEEQKRQ